MTNEERWALYMSKVASPESFIRWGWYGIISAALQRKVWIGDEETPIFPNTYIIFVGDAGVGKGMVLGPVNNLLRHHPYIPPKVDNAEVFMTARDKDIERQSLDAVLEATQTVFNLAKQSAKRESLIAGAPDTTTFEAIMRSLAKSARLVKTTKINGNGVAVPHMYFHWSLSFVLEELSSLFRKHMEDIVTFFLKTYDCKTYEYITKTQGEDIIKNCCVNMIAGTTPTFMQRVFTDELLTEGFASRTFFIYETKNRFSTLLIPKFTPEQMQAKFALLARIKQLASSSFYGPVSMTQEAHEFMDSWWKEEERGSQRANKSPKLVPYYARKNLHVMKLAMVLHFSESDEMIIPLATFQRAISELKIVEQSMHHAVTLDNKNPQSMLAKKVVRHIAKFGAMPKSEIITQFFGDIETGIQGIEQTLEYLMTTRQVETQKQGARIFYKLPDDTIESDSTPVVLPSYTPSNPPASEQSEASQ